MPSLVHLVARRPTYGDWRDTTDPEVFVEESWSEGFYVGTLLIMAVITFVSMRKGILLHRLILLEVSICSRNCFLRCR